MNQDWLTIVEKDQEVILKKCSEDAKGEIIVPDGVTRIGSFAFTNCKLVKNIVFPNSLMKIGMFALTNCTGLNYLRIPASVKEIAVQKMLAHLSVLDFEGNIPKTEWTFNRSSIEELRVNSTRKNTQIPKDIMDALGYGTHWGDPGRIIYAAPELCKEEFPIPGYIMATSADTDEAVAINTKYIISVNTLEIERYHAVIGSRITCTAEGNNNYYQIDVYEPCDIIMKKIASNKTRN